MPKIYISRLIFKILILLPRFFKKILNLAKFAKFNNKKKQNLHDLRNTDADLLHRSLN